MCVALGFEMLSISIIFERVNFRGLLIDGDLPHAYLGSNTDCIHNNLKALPR